MNNIEKLEQDIELTIKSINHWCDVYTENKVYGVYHCPLCSQYHSKVNKDIDNYICCNECPIYEKTNHVFCKETPYDNIVKISSDDTENIKKESINMITFLSELLKELNYKLKEDKKNLKSKFAVGDFVKVKLGILSFNKELNWPELEKFPCALFKVKSFVGDKQFRCYGYLTERSQDNSTREYYFYIDHFEKIIPEIKKEYIGISKTEGWRNKFKIVETDLEFMDNKNLVLIQRLKDKKMELMTADDIQIIQI